MSKSIITLLAFLLSFSAFAADPNQTDNPFLTKDHFPGGYFLMPDSLPHFMGVYMKEGGMHKIDPSEAQQTAIEERFKSMVSFIMPTAEKIKKIETKIMHQVVFEGKTKQDLSLDLQQIAKLRMELTELQIECLNFFKKTLKTEQYEKMIQLAQEHPHE